MNGLASSPDIVHLLEILKPFPVYNFDKGDFILGESKCFDNNVLFVIKGQGIVYTKRDYPLKDIVNGYFLSNNFLNLFSLYSATNNLAKEYAIASAKVSLKVIPLFRFQELLLTNKTLNNFVINELLRTSRQKQIELHRKFSFSSKKIILCFLIDYVKDFGKRMGYEWVIPFPFSMTQIGELTHTSRQSSSTLLNELKKEGIIHFNRKYLIIRELEELKKLSKT